MDIMLTSALVVLSIIAIIIFTSKLKFNVFGSLFVISFVLALCTMPLNEVVNTLKSSFGATMGGISFVIIFGATIAVCMEKSGGALSIATHILAKAGRNNAKPAMALTGFIPGLTIFCDTGFIILSGIARNFSAQSKTAMPLMGAILGTSLYAVHCLVPTHPGALGAATELNANLGLLVVAGILFSIPGMLAAYFWAGWMSKGKNYAPATIEEEAVEVPLEELPSFFNSLVPVVLPLVLISISTLALAMGFKEGPIAAVVHFAGNPVIALLVGVVAGFLLLLGNSKAKKVNLNEVVDDAIKKAGPILVITAAGGMFGAVIKATGVGGELGKVLGSASIGLFIPFVIAALLKTAQGSSTIAAITTAAIVGPLLGDFGLDSEMGRMFSVLALGAGSVVVSHANDSYFWVVTKFSNIDVNDSLRVFTSSTLVMGITMFVCIWLTSLFMI